MLFLLSPAKTLDMDTTAPTKDFTQPAFLEQSQTLVDILRDYSGADIAKLMHLSDKLADLNTQRYQDYSTPFTLDNAKQAVYAFKGDTYIGLDALTLKDSDIPKLQDSGFILSGLYGLLRPLDLMQAYRLEMGTRLENPEGKNLYAFWKTHLTTALNAALKTHNHKQVICLASKEYISAIEPNDLTAGMINIDFKDMKNGIPKTIGIFVKRARGMMARYMVENDVQTPDDLKDFDVSGYAFQPKASDESNFVFLRDQDG